MALISFISPSPLILKNKIRKINDINLVTIVTSTGFRCFQKTNNKKVFPTYNNEVKINVFIRLFYNCYSSIKLLTLA